LVEMAFAGHCGLDIALPVERGGVFPQLFSEELGVVLQVRADDEQRLVDILARHGLEKSSLFIGTPTSELRVRMRVGDTLLDETWVDLRRAWSETSWRMRRMRDDPGSADEEYAAQSSADDPGLAVKLSFDPEEDISAPFIARGARPAVAVLREQGV